MKKLMCAAAWLWCVAASAQLIPPANGTQGTQGSPGSVTNLHGAGYVQVSGDGTISLTAPASNAVISIINGDGSVLKSNVTLNLVTTSGNTTTNDITVGTTITPDEHYFKIIGWDNQGLNNFTFSFGSTNALYFSPLWIGGGGARSVILDTENFASLITNQSLVLPPGIVTNNMAGAVLNGGYVGLLASNANSLVNFQITNSAALPAGTVQSNGNAITLGTAPTVNTNLNLLSGSLSTMTADVSKCAGFRFTNALQGALNILVTNFVSGGYADISGIATNAKNITFDFEHSIISTQAGSFPFSPTNNFDILIGCDFVGSTTNSRLYGRQN